MSRFGSWKDRMRRKAHTRPGWERVFAPRALLGYFYALAAALWVLWVLLNSAVALDHKMNGTMRTQTLGPGDLTFESFMSYAEDEWATPPDDREGWYLSTDNDPHIFWQGEAFVVSVRLEVEQLLPPGSVALYYLTPGQTDYRESQKVYAWRDGDNGYVFDLGGITVTGLRIDPDSVGGVPTRLIGLELNPSRPWFCSLLPGGGQWLLLLFGPPLAAALAALVWQAVKND